MSSPVLTNLPRPAAYRKPGADVYTALLALAAVALILGMLCLYFEMQRFEFDLKPPPAPGMATATVPSDALAVQAVSFGSASAAVLSYPTAHC